MAPRKKIKRKRGSKSNLYFTDETQRAIVEFQSEDDPKAREKLYVEEIMPAFSKLTENLIFVYEFSKGPDSYEVLKNDCVEFLYETIHKFDESKGSKAFSYFNIVAKNWLIIKSKQRATNTKRNISLSDINDFSARDSEVLESHNVVPSPDDIMIDREFRDLIMKNLIEIKSRLTNENEIICINSVIKIFENIDDLELLNKRAVFLYIREMSGLTPKQLTVAMSNIKKIYRTLRGSDEFRLF